MHREPQARPSGRLRSATACSAFVNADVQLNVARLFEFQQARVVECVQISPPRHPVLHARMGMPKEDMALLEELLGS